MIDLGLSKLAIIGVVALIVIGPQKLPKMARIAGTLYGRAQRYLHDIKSQVSRELELGELRDLQKDVRDSAQSFKAELEHTMSGQDDEGETQWDGGGTRNAAVTALATSQDIDRKARYFRRQKLAHISAVPAWYRNRHGTKSHVISGAARVHRYRLSAVAISSKSFFR